MSGFSQKRIPSGPDIASLPRAISKLGICSRSKAEEFIKKGFVTVNGKTISDISLRVNLKKDKIKVTGETPAEEKIYLMLNKQRGLVTTASDEKGRETVFSCFEGKNLPYIFPVGRLDKASEGLLLFTNDTAWGNKITSPGSGIEKTYHVQIGTIISSEIISQIKEGIRVENELLKVEDIMILRKGEKNCWVEIILEEGKNRHIRKIFENLGIEVIRLIRTGIGPLALGALPKGEFRILTDEEISSLV
jgi:23S rRNA pseudouridine2605 synthase